MAEEEAEYEPEYEERVYLTRCICEHEDMQHRWGGGCDVEGCPCEGSWEE